MSKSIDVKSAPELLRVVRAVDPKYRKHKVILCVYEQVTLSGTYWDGGSRSSYTAVDIKTGRVGPAPQYNPPQFGGPVEAPRVDIPDGVAIVETGFFCGKPKTATVFVNPRTATPLLPA